MQARSFGDPALTEAYNAGLNRIFAMSRVHELLYQSEHAGTLDLGLYLDSLAQDLRRLHESDGFAPEMRMTVKGSVQLGLDKITPVALIVNEVLTNGLRHAFKGRRQGRVEIALNVEAGAARLEIADDGVGLKADWRGGKGSIGIRLVEMMVRQVEGEVEFLARPGGGTRVVVRWPVSETAGA
jgi:two-component sensor histidine kinase